MNTYFRNVLAILISVILGVSLMSFINGIPPKEKWNIPEEYKKMRYPFQQTAENYKLGKQEFSKNCASCHGDTGNGDGVKVKELIEKSVRPANFRLNEFQKEEPGIHFYKIKFGREGMHSFKGKLDDETIWEIVLHMSTFK